MKILIVEDDFVIAESLASELKKWNYGVIVVEQFDDILSIFNQHQPQLVLLDINLPTLNGFHWCQEIRKTSNVPIIFISSRIDNMDQIMAIQMGGDDFIEKPFNLSLTIAKIQALLRRTYDLSVANDSLTVKGCTLILDEAKVVYQEQNIQLSLTELQILKLLFQNEDKYVSRTALIEKCWESENFIDDNTLAVNMTRLRKKLNTIGVILLLLLIFIGIKYLSFVKTISQQQQIENLENALYQLKNEQIEYKNDVESYFLTWVHQMKTPITAAQLLLERDEPNVVNRVRQEVIQIDNYTSLALSYLKLLNETSDISVTKISINNIIRPIIMKYSIQFIDQKTKIHYEPCHHEVLTDVRWTSLLIEQLINNALKYARGKDIWIEFDEQSNQLYVKDNGIGISEADLPKIFDKGYSGYNGQRQSNSSGIGLFIVKQISTHTNHPVSVVSKQNEGTTFTIQFPDE
ncbi:integral membrane sensor signal transduction histidine kinase [Staphylococcus aureus]|nr:integral membrane sensor signal transduction histidine kinase [Staphylococcus aureus]GBS17279.1 integral membrane sensor signal transduction histidine kinase [Staphylococcus aureus]GBT23851.1 integral membrane sensor signal transduction histidine kinase [Staphylococcus aureus]GBV12007.1 integral membrane sensor signal transduction histidine kinase [Staphylococcus aureus]GBX77423.1 integral membrane sensor signal transduction histidine kinase [Staphylococcus aureus]